MADQTHSNLEPIEEEDLNLKEKFVVSAPDKPEVKSEKNPEEKIEPLPTKEQAPERKEGMTEKEASYTKILSKVTSPIAPVPSDEKEVANDSIKVNEEMDEEGKIKNLVNLAELKGIPHAVKVARHYEDNYLLDEFHDRMLSDVLHDALVKKGLIKEI